MPSSYEVSTRKYILPEIDEAPEPHETDIVIFSPGYPEAFRGREEVLAGGVAAAFNVLCSGRARERRSGRATCADASSRGLCRVRMSDSISEGHERLPERLTPHSLRRTFAAILVADGKDPTYVMGQLGHTDPGLTLRIYSHQMRRRDGEHERLQSLVKGESWGTRRHPARFRAPATVEAARADARNASDLQASYASPAPDSNRRPLPYHGSALPTELAGRRGGL